jgi:predicted hydrocarbon binding protein
MKRKRKPCGQKSRPKDHLPNTYSEDGMNHEILKELNVVVEKGGLFYRDVRYLLIRPETLATFQKAIEKELGEKASQVLFEAGFEGGALSSKKYREVFGLSDQEIIQFMMDMGPQIGWGRFELERFNPGERCLIVKVYHSPFAEAYGSSSLPVCHLIRGVLGGMASTVFGRKTEAIESSCLAKGDKSCRFEII